MRSGSRIVGLLLAVALAFACEAKPQEMPVRAGSSSVSLSPLRDGFEGSSLASFWLPGDHGSGRYAPRAISLSRERARSGLQSARITLNEGDVAQLGDSGQENERAELDSGRRPLLGEDVWCSFSLLVPAEFPRVDARLVLSQWKQSGLEGSPIFAQRLRDGEHYVTIRDLSTRGSWRESRLLPPLVLGRWHDFVCHVRFSYGADGLVELWMDGEHVFACDGPTASPRGADDFYHKLGLYRDRMREPMTIWVDDYALGSDFDAVDPAQVRVEKAR